MLGAQLAVKNGRIVQKRKVEVFPLDGWFLKEELTRDQGNIFFVHTKYLLIDPLSDDPLICTGSANFSENSLTTNDENMILIRGSTRVADIYMTEFDRLFRHFYFRDVANETAIQYVMLAVAGGRRRAVLLCRVVVAVAGSCCRAGAAHRNGHRARPRADDHRGWPAYACRKQPIERRPPILGIYTVSNPGVRARLGATDPAMTVPSVKKLAIKDAVRRALVEHGEEPPHRFGMSDDDPNNVVLAISAMRDCKLQYPNKRFFVINTNHEEYVKLEIFPMAHPVTAAKSGAHLLQDDS